MKMILVMFITIVLDLLGIAFLALKFVSVPFVPSRNIDNMSDYYTAVWESVKGRSNDNGRFFVIDITNNSRDEIASILESVNSMNPRVIGLDVTNIWEEDESIDKHFVNTIKSIPNIILPIECYDMEQNTPHFLYSIFREQLIEKNYGVVSFPETRDILRTYCPQFKDGNKTLDAFGCAIAKAYGANLRSVGENDNVLINYTTLHLTDEDANEGREFLNLSKQDSTSLASEINGRIVLVGSTNLSSDKHLTPLGYDLSGVMVHAHIINSLIDNRSITSTPLILRYVLCCLFAFFAFVILKKYKKVDGNKNNIWWSIIKCTLLFLLSMMLFAGIGTILFCKFCYYVDFAPYIVTLILVYILKDKSISIKIK